MKERGFSLVEVMVGMSIFLLIMSVFPTLIGSLNSYTKIEVEREKIERVVYPFFDIIKRDIQNGRRGDRLQGEMVEVDRVEDGRKLGEKKFGGKLRIYTLDYGEENRGRLKVISYYKKFNNIYISIEGEGVSEILFKGIKDLKFKKDKNLLFISLIVMGINERDYNYRDVFYLGN